MRSASLRASARTKFFPGPRRISPMSSCVLDGGRAVLDGIEGEDVADVHGELALGAGAIGAAQSLEGDRADAVVEEEAHEDGHAVCVGLGLDADVAEVAGGEERLDRVLLA